MSEQWLSATASDLGRGIAAGDIDPVDLTKTYLDAGQAHELSARIYARFTPERALAEAEAASGRAKLGLRRSLLDGVPISWKDLFDTAGTVTEAGTALLKGRVPDADAEVLRNATSAGLVCLGKTHMSELAFSGLGLNPGTATPPSVNDLESVSGGSSSGAATSVAFNLAAAGIGSDTGGSVRIPSAWNDLVGLKTTLGRLSVEGSVPLCAKFDTVGPLTRSVEDAAQLLAAMEGRKPIDIRNAELAGARLLVLENVAFDDIRDAPRSGFQSAVERLQGTGAIVDRGEISEVSEALALTGILFPTEGYAQHEALIEANPDLMFPEILERFRSGKDTPAKDYLQACQKLDVLRVKWAEKTASYDAVILPTSPVLPPNLERLLTDHDYYVAENLLALRNTRIGNLFGNSGLTLPTGVPSCGIMFLAAPFAEEKLLRLGAAAEAALA
jgi:aspartyl-tRNA(Asn)/glutamyl-tRNA(Gln) amidotransferase subunit A